MKDRNRSAATIAGAVGSAAVAAALLYANKRRNRNAADARPPHTSTAPHYDTTEKPETD